jgi:signal transduction histidine kinase
VDAVFIKIVFSNLCANAVKFSQKGGKVQVNARRLERFVEVCIVDEGVGMNPELLEDVLRFAKAVPREGTDKEKGVGIGMNIVKMILDQHNAKIEIQSQLGKGTRVKILFPN